MLPLLAMQIGTAVTTDGSSGAPYKAVAGIPSGDCYTKLMIFRDIPHNPQISGTKLYEKAPVGEHRRL
jgi:hypothetical protein